MQILLSWYVAPPSENPELVVRWLEGEQGLLIPGGVAELHSGVYPPLMDLHLRFGWVIILHPEVRDD